jgi:hypothetical protein
VNGIYPDVDGLDADPEVAAEAAGVSLRAHEADALRAAAAFRHDRMVLQREQVARLDERLPLPQLRLPYQFTTSIGPEEIDALAEAVRSEITKLDARSMLRRETG